MLKMMMVLLSLYFLWPANLMGEERGTYSPLIPLENLEEIRGNKNPFPLDQKLIEKGKTLYETRAFCAACPCQGRVRLAKGFGTIPALAHHILQTLQTWNGKLFVRMASCSGF